MGSISILGIEERQAKLSLLEKNKDAPLTNNGIIYLKNAEFEQAARFSGEGCIVVGHNGNFRTVNILETGHQRFHFFDGTGVFNLVTSDIPQDNRYYITNFPKGATIQVAGSFTNWRVEGSDFIYFNELGSMRIKFTFERYHLEEGKVLIDGNKMTYAEDLVRRAPDSRCVQMDQVMAQASKYEIKSE